MAAASPWAIVDHDHPTAGTVRTFRSPIALDGDASDARPARRPRSASTPSEVLRELGYAGAELAELLAGPCRPG